MPARLGLALALGLSTAACGAAPPTGAAVTQVVDDHALHKRLEAEAVTRIERRQYVATATLVRQLHRKQTAPVPITSLPPSQDRAARALQARRSVLILGTLYQCDHCSRWHVGIATAFAISADGTCVTNYHVIDRPQTETIVAMTSDGRVLGVREVLAASKADDLAIIRLDGGALVPLPLGDDPSLGMAVQVISHPTGRFYTLTEGIVSRTYRARLPEGTSLRTEITADFAKGSSGAPVLDARGAVVGVASNTRSLYYHEDDKGKEDLQMVLKRAIPVAALKRLLRGGEGTPGPSR